MTSIRDGLKHFEKFVTDNSPGILTGIGVVGTVATAYLTGKATFKAARIRDEELSRAAQEELPTIRQAQLLAPVVWKLYIPAVGTGVMTVACIVGANRVGTRRAAALAAAYSISERALDEYKAKVIEKIGEKKERDIRDEVAQDRVSSHSMANTEVIITGDGDVLCYDMYTGRTFKSSVESLRKAQNDLNHKILNNFYASLSDFYDLIGLARTTTSDDVGWNCDQLLELIFSTTMTDDQRPCIAVNFKVTPIRNYFRVQ